METINGLYKTECIRTTVFQRDQAPVEYKSAYYEALNRAIQPA